MDGAIAASSAEAVRRTSVRFSQGAFSTSLADGPSMHAGLFEQFLNFATPETSHPIEPSADRNHTPPAQTEDASDSDDSETASTVVQPESNQPSAEDEAEQGAVEDQVAILTATATVTSTSTAGDKELVEQTVEQTPVVDKQPTAEQGESRDERVGQSLLAEDAPQTNVNSNENVGDAQSVGSLPTSTSTEAPNATQELRIKPLKRQTAQEYSNDDQIPPADESLQPSTSLEQNEPSIEEVAELNPLDEQPVPLPDADSREPARHRGEERSKWYTRDLEPASIAQQVADERPDASRADTADQNQPSEWMTENHPATEPKPHQPPSPPTAIENTVAVVSNTIPIAENVTSRLIASQSLQSDVSAIRDGDTSASTSAIEPGKPSGKSNSPEAKGDSAPAQRSEELSQAERVRLVQRVSRSFARLGPTGGQVNIRLHPPQLGSLSIQVRMEGRTMTAKLSTESEAARDAIVESLPVLRGRLAEQGFEISSFQVEVADNNNTELANNNQQSWSNQTGSNESNSSRQVDYRRLAAQQRQSLNAVGRQSSSAEAPQLAWQAMAGIDFHA